MAKPMRHRPAVMAFISLLLVTSKFDTVMTQTGSAACPNGFTYVASVNGCYQLILQKQTWQNATQTCASLASGAHLAFVTSVNEDQAVSGLAKPSSGPGACFSDYYGLGSEWWLGAQRIEPTYRSDFYWKVSEKGGPVAGLDYDNWNGGQPDYIGTGEQCATFVPNWSNRWNDAPCLGQTFCSVCEVDVPVPSGYYCITVFTSNIANAATQAKVFITLYGDTNSTEYNLINSAVDSFAQGQVSKFCLPIPSVGALNRINIRHDNTGGAPGWFLDKVVVEDSTQTYTFPAYRWLAVDENDKLTSADLTLLGHQNLALLKRTWQSSTWGLWGSSRAVDGSKDRMARDLGHCSSTQNEMNAWWAVDLGSPANVHAVQITSRADGGGDYLSQLLVGLTNSPPKPTTPVPVPINYYLCNSGPQTSKLAEYIYVLCQKAPNQPSTRYVVVQLNQTTSFLTLCEVEVFGTLDTSACSSNPCLNGGTCYSQGTTAFTCSCAVGYSGPTCATPGCPDGFVYMSGVNGCYRLIISDQQWADSAALCASYAKGAHLAVVSSDLEQQAIASLITAYYAIDSSYSGTDYSCNGAYFGLGPEWWLAGQRQDPTANTPFVWRTTPSSNVTSPLVYTNWNPGQPDYCCGGESCMVTVTNWGFNWNDSPCTSQIFCGVCEFDLPNIPIVNLALKQPTSASSMYSNWASTRGVDGNKVAVANDQGSCFGTLNTFNAWWAVDVGIPAFVQGVQLVPRKDCCVSQSSNLYIGLTNIAPSVSTPPQYPNLDLCARGPLSSALNDIYMVQCAPNLPASRYVAILNDGSDHIVFCEVEVYGRFVTGACANMPCLNGGTCTTSGSSYTCACAVGFTGSNCSTAATNLALSKTSVQSSTYGTWLAGKANDGNPNTTPGGSSSCSQTDFDQNAWWSVDLVTPTFVQGVQLANRNDGMQDRQNNFIVGLTNLNPAARKPHPTSYTVGVCGRGPKYTLAGQNYWVRCDPSLPSARYVVIQVETQVYLAICELFVYGQPDNGPCASQPCANGGLCQNTGSSYTCNCAVGFLGPNCSTVATNLALNRPAWTSSVYATWQPGFATDGSKLTSAGKCSATGNDWSAWWATDLGSQVYVQGVSVLNRGDCCGGFDSLFNVGLTNTAPTQNIPDPTNYALCGVGPTVSDLNEVYYIKCAANLAPSRFVVIQLPVTVTNFLTLCEVEVYGVKDSSACSSNPCRNGGTCTSTGSGYTCTCFAGWTGANCETAALNIARGRPTLQSTTYGLWVASRAVDGNKADCWGDLASVTSTLAEPHPWWSVDLGEPTYVQGVMYAMSTVAYQGDPKGTITIGLTNRPPALRAPTPGGYEICGNSISAQIGSAQIYILCKPNLAPYRYVIVQFEKTDYLRVCELEVYNNQGPCGSNPCQNGGACTNAGVGFTCTCAVGFSGSDCSIRADPCASSPCANGGQCTASATSFTYTCSCASGWTGTNCQTRVDPCASSPCANGGQCTASTTSFSYTCSCASGWTGTNCQTKVDPCASSPCANGGQCTASTTSFSYTCSCASGWTGTNCQTRVDPCASSPCANGGQCTASTTSFSYTCSCASGWTGTNCQTKVDPCASSPCANGGQCTASATSFTYTCSCANGWTGTNCQTKVDPCASSPCANGGKCTASGTSYTCACASGWTGINCQTKVDPCQSSPCANGGQCTASGTSYTCACASGWAGTNCQSKVDPCASSPCANGGQCTASATSFTFTCACASGWTGTNCQTKVDPCASSPCANGGQCTANGTSYTCACASGWTGTNCQTISGNICLVSNPCKNGGTCHQLGDGYYCTCPPAYTGMSCELDQAACLAYSDNTRLNCGFGGVTASYCHNVSCCFDSSAPSRNQAACFFSKSWCKAITVSQRVDCYKGNPVAELFCNQRGCCWDSTAPTTGLRCYRAAARNECIGVPASKRIALKNPPGTPNDCESRGGCWDSSVRDQPALWCFTIAP